MFSFLQRRAEDAVGDDELRYLISEHYQGSLPEAAAAIGATPGKLFGWTSKPAGIEYRIPRRVERRARAILDARKPAYH